MKNNKKLHIVYVALIVVLLGIMFLRDDKIIEVLEIQETTGQEEFTYSSEKMVVVTREEFSVTDVFTAEFLYDGRCEEKEKEYFENVLKPYTAEDMGVRYFFRYTKSPLENEYMVTVIPNKLTENDDFMSAFAACYAGGRLYPHLESDKYLLFISSCGSGVESTSGAHCDEAKDAIQPTLKLK